MICLGKMYSSDHDSMAGYGQRIGYRYKTSITITIKSVDWNRLKKTKQIGSFALDVKNAVYEAYGFTQTYCPQIDTNARAKKGIVSIQVDFFHNSNEDVLKTEYNQENGYLKHHVRAAERDAKYAYNPSQSSLDPNNQ